jgi:hypothetical protein
MILADEREMLNLFKWAIVVRDKEISPRHRKLVAQGASGDPNTGWPAAVE